MFTGVTILRRNEEHMSHWVVTSWLVKPPKLHLHEFYDEILYNVAYLKPGNLRGLELLHLHERLVLTKQMQFPAEHYDARFWYFAGAYYAQCEEWDRAYQAWSLCARNCPPHAKNAAALTQLHYRWGEAAYQINQHAQAFVSYGQVIDSLTSKPENMFKFERGAGEIEIMLVDALFHRAYLAYLIHFADQARLDLHAMLRIIDGWTPQAAQRQETLVERVKTVLTLPATLQLDPAWGGIFANLEVFADLAPAPDAH
jgi:hypothetical protein